ncbi:MAG TPA: amidohydrolase family protein [Phycisphaerae bacterium]|nr:amidohydrolase family protein [Phycisphaerales bacterium]HRX85500.1 amidohydrolase family protein [Phycisphaerae bacterium]
MILRAAYVLNLKFQPMPNWAVRVHKNGIVEVGPAKRIQGETTTDLGDVLLIPGLVNAHAHLELGHLAGKVPPEGGLVDWLGRLLPRLRDVPPDAPEVAEAIEAGLAAALHSGTTLIGDITRSPETSRAAISSLARRPKVVSFGEVIALGTLRDRLAPALDAATAPPPEAVNLEIGISPHAPYTVEPEGLKACAERARAADLPLCIHAAESKEELQFTREGRGPLRDFLEAAGVWDERAPVPGCSPIELLERCGVLGPRTLLAHCNYLSDTDMELIAKSRSSVVYCPRTHAAFGHPRHPVAELQARKIRVCLGTDSLASNPSLSMLEELRFLRDVRPDIEPTALLDMATIEGTVAVEGLVLSRARPIGGILGGGYRADLAALAIPHGTTWKNAIEHALDEMRLMFVMQGGRVVRSLDGIG